MEEKERRSQMIVIDFGLLLTTKPGFVRFEIEGTATLKGKEDEMDKMLEPDPNTKAPLILNKIYQRAFIAMYTLSAILGAPPPPHELIPTITKENAQEATTEETRSIEGTKLTSSS
ncbi:MAG: hypothetical protein QXT06_03895 [Candidatus Bathyarchaeia archaeon]|nr:hypothetical protein [Candidatus Bathyarchaeota archaeon]